MFLQDLLNFYQKVEKIKEENIGEFGTLASPIIPITIATIYFVFVTIIGPKIMKNRSSCNITYLILGYNLFQILFNVYLWTQVCYYIYANLNRIQCIDMEKPGSENFNFIRTVNWLFVINKFFDLLDTVFFVLRKKQSHVSFLHVYHHLLTFNGAWYLARYAPGGQVAVFAFLNTLVHVVMYSYYFISCTDVFKSYAICLKKPTTQLQIMQFIIAGIHALYGLLDEECTYPRYLIYFGLIQDAIMIILFVTFYKNTYTNKKTQTMNQA